MSAQKVALDMSLGSFFEKTNAKGILKVAKYSEKVAKLATLVSLPGVA